MNMLLERQTPPITPASRQGTNGRIRHADANFDNDLLAMLARLDHCRYGMDIARQHRQQAAAVELARQIVREIVALGRRYLPADADDVQMARHQIAQFEADAKQVHEWLTVPGIGNLFGLLGRKSSNPEECRRRFDKCLQSMVQVVQAFFTLFTNRFPTSNLARGWVESASVYLVELKRGLRDWAE